MHDPLTTTHVHDHRTDLLGGDVAELGEEDVEVERLEPLSLLRGYLAVLVRERLRPVSVRGIWVMHTNG